MKILFEGECLKDYLAKCHEAFRTGLRSIFDTRMYGKGYEGYDPSITNYSEIIKKVFKNEKPDLIVTVFDSEYALCKIKFNYDGMDKINIPKAIVLSDYWNLARNYKYEFEKEVIENNVDFIISLFPQPLKIWEDTLIKDRFIYVPFTFDPKIFNAWDSEKCYDVGFLAAGTYDYTDFYPERYKIHHKLLENKNIKYLWAKHPGWNVFNNEHPLVGENFSKAINSCKIFVTTGGKYHNAQPKIFEALASKTLVMSDRVLGEEFIGLKNNVNYVLINEDNVIEKINYYLENPKILNEISENGYKLALRYHSCYARANDFYDIINEKLSNRTSSNENTVLIEKDDKDKINFWNIDFMEELSKEKSYYEEVDTMKKKFVKELASKIKGANCYIWGGGIHTLKLIRIFNDVNYDFKKFKGIIDSNELKAGNKISGIEIFFKEQLLNDQKHNITDIIISSEKYEKDIAKEINDVFGDKVNIIRLYDEKMSLINPIKYYSL